MGYVSFKELGNTEFAQLPHLTWEDGKMGMSSSQANAWKLEMRSRIFRGAHSFTKTMVVVDLTQKGVQELGKFSRDDITTVLSMACRKVLPCHKKLVLKAPSSGSEEAAKARDAFMATLGFKWVAGKSQRYERGL